MSKSLHDKEIEKGYQLNNFYKAGTTTQLRVIYKKYLIGDDLKKELSSDKIQLLKNLLQKSNFKRHKQKKIAGIYAAVELCSTENCFCLLLTKETLFDISNNVEYSIPEDAQITLKDLFR